MHPRRLRVWPVLCGALASCLGALPLDREKADAYRRKYMMDCQHQAGGAARALEAHTSSASAGAARPKGKLSKALIQENIEHHIDEVRACYVEAQHAWPELHGRVHIKFVIAPDGAVVAAAPIKDTSGVPALGCCITHAVRTWQFPPPDAGGIVIVEYPFHLAQR